MYVILGILYESYIHPITVLSTLPVASLGGLATLKLFGMPLDLYGFIGLFLLLGLIKKNGIMLIDFAIMRRREGLGVEAAALKAAIERVRPILMTTFAAFSVLFRWQWDSEPWIVQTTDGSLHRRRARRRADPHAVLHSGFLRLHGGLPRNAIWTRSPFSSAEKVSLGSDTAPV